MAYRFKGDPKWEDLISIYGPREPVGNVIVLSSDESDDNNMGRATHTPPVAQRSMWEYIGYASDSDDASMDANSSTANSRKEMRKIRDARKRTEEATTSTHNRTIGRSSGNSFNNSSCASNDPCGKRNM